ncbi:hypothetical protein G4B88_026298, partial [Cannabis sativa]
MIYATPLAIIKLVITTKTNIYSNMGKKSMEQYSAVPYLATLINCLVWTLYWLPFIHPRSILVVTINGSGLIRRKLLKLFFLFLLSLFSFLFSPFLTLSLTHSRKHCWYHLYTFNIMMYAALLVVMKLVITTKSVEFMLFFLSFLH